MTPRQVSWFSNFVRTLYNFKTLFRQVARHVTWRRCTKFDVSSWIETQHTPNTMNNIFRSTRLQYSMHLQFKFKLYIKIQHNQINQPNITKKTRKSIKFEHEVVNNVGGPNKKFGVKKTKKNENLPSASLALGKDCLCRVLAQGHSAKIFKKKNKKTVKKSLPTA